MDKISDCLEDRRDCLSDFRDPNEKSEPSEDVEFSRSSKVAFFSIGICSVATKAGFSLAENSSIGSAFVNDADSV